MNILFVGRFFSSEIIKTISDDSFGKIGFSNHNFEMSFLKGLSEQKDIHVKAVTCPGVPSYPHNYKKLYVKQQVSDVYGIPYKSCGFLNLVALNRYSRIHSLEKNILHAIKDLPEGPVNIIVNTSGYEMLKAVSNARKKSSRKTTLTVVIPDVPSMLTSMQHYSLPKRLLLPKLDEEAVRLTEQADHLVLLTKQMKDLYKTPSSYLVMEGLINLEKIITQELNKSEKEIILYTGTLRKQFGVLNLLAAFKEIEREEENVELWICGSGDAEDTIRNESKKDSRIKFYGLVSSEKALMLQRDSSILVNPRTSEGEYTKYSFPSKTIEYLLAKKSVILNRLSGIPEDYFDFVFTPDSESVDDLAKTILRVIHTPKDERERMANDGYNYVINNKNASVQVGRILKMISSK